MQIQRYIELIRWYFGAKRMVFLANMLYFEPIRFFCCCKYSGIFDTSSGILGKYIGTSAITVVFWANTLVFEANAVI